MSDDLNKLVAVARRHGLATTRRALVHLFSVAIYVQAEPEGKRTQLALAAWWGDSKRTTDREAASWRTVTGDADVWAVADEVVAEGVLAKLDRGDRTVGALALAGWL